MPTIPFSPPVEDLISNFTKNWSTLTPALSVLFGVIFATFVIAKVMKHFKGDD